MTPAARLSAAIEVLDRILAGAPVEQTLTNWGRGHRFAGSGDRQALRDLVFGALRRRRSLAALGGGLTGRGLMLGWARANGAEALFSGEGHAPAPVGADEAGHMPEGDAALDVPDWLAPQLRDSLGDAYAAVMTAMQDRAPVFVRVNVARTNRQAVVALLAEDGITAEPVDWVNTALQVTGNARKIQMSRAYLDGLVELQDAASQGVVAALGVGAGMRVLDYCAGGGGKTLALAALGAQVQAHDANPQRMAGLPARAARAGVRVDIVAAPKGQYDLVMMDVPCSGSGSWRRDPQGKWALDAAALTALLATQAAILEGCAPLAPRLAYATCSVLRSENEDQIATFLHRNRGWRVEFQTRFSPLQGGDGFFVALLTRSDLVTPQP